MKILRSMMTLLLVACAGNEQSVSQQQQDVSEHRRAIGQNAKVMTRNLYLGADLTPAMSAQSEAEFLAATTAILGEVTATNFAVRAKGLAAEILATQPDLVGLQEAARWTVNGVVRDDHLMTLLGELGGAYQPAVVQEEFDFTAPAFEDGALVQARLTMRDVILVRVDAGIRLSNPQSAHFDEKNLMQVNILGTPMPVVRGWTAVDAQVRGTTAFRFVNTHFEAYHPGKRMDQALELVGPELKLTGALPVVLVGDLNTDDDTVSEVDAYAYQALLGAGFVERSTNDPLSCCIESSDDLTGGGASEFDHQVDHIMTNAPGTVVLLQSGVTGLTKPATGWWDSDHAGVWSYLRIR